MRIAKIILSGLLTLILIFAVVVGGSIAILKNDLPDVSTLKNIELQQPLQIFTADGKLIAEIGEQRRIPVSLDKIPPTLINAFLAIEDSRFYDHFGVDPIGIMRAVYVVASNGGRIKQGASTITQQLARNFFLSNEKTLSRKIKEAILALEIEETLSKQEILELYLNKIYLGNRAYGVAAAAQTYFGKTLDQLNLSEMAIIAGLPKAPSTLNPIASVQRATERRNVVLARMLEMHFITQEQYNSAINEPVISKYHGANIELTADYVAEMVRQQMVEKYGEEEAYNKGFKVYTTINSKAQVLAQNAVRNNIIDYDMRHGYRKPRYLWTDLDNPWTKEQIQNYLKNLPSGTPFVPAAVINKTAFGLIFMLASGVQDELSVQGMDWIKKNNFRVKNMPRVGDLIWVRKVDGQWQLGQIPEVNSGLVSLDSTDGAIEALVGGFSFGFSKFNRATQSLVQVGSVIKPFIFAAVLERGLTLATMLQDSPIVLTQGKGLPSWQPLNSPNRFDGAMRLRKGLGLSKNMISIRAIKVAGIPFTAQYLTRFGLPEKRYSANASLALGTAEFTPLELARAYAVIDNGGFLITPYLIQRIMDNDNQEVFIAKPKIACTTCDSIPVIYDSVKKIDLSTQKEFATVSVIEDEQLPPGNPIQEEEGEIKDITEKVDSETDPILKLQDLKTDNEKILEAKKKDKTNIVQNDTKSDNKDDDKTEVKINNPANKPEIKESKYAPRVIDGGIAFLIKNALHTAIYGEQGQTWLGTSWKIRKSIQRSDISGKTGTTNKNKVAWYAGFAGKITTTTYVGFDNNSLNLGKNEGGARTAMPAWLNYMQALLENVPDKKVYIPKNIVSRVIEPETGLLMPASEKDQGIVEYFIKGTEPTQVYIPQGQGYIDVSTTREPIDEMVNPEAMNKAEAMPSGANLPTKTAPKVNRPIINPQKSSGVEDGEEFKTNYEEIF